MSRPDALEGLRSSIRARPRFAAAIGFGATAGLLTHFGWIPAARFSGVAPMLTMSAGLAHAVAGALVGGRVLDATRTRTAWEACLRGAMTSLVALALVSPGLAWWITSTGSQPGVFSFLALVFLTAFFSFLAIGWALLIASMGVAWGLFRFGRISGPRSAVGPSSDGRQVSASQ